MRIVFFGSAETDGLHIRRKFHVHLWDEGEQIGWISTGANTYLARAAKLFLLHGKTLKVDGDFMLHVDADELDRKFFVLAKSLEARYGVWKKVVEMLQSGHTREEVITYLTAEAAATELSRRFGGRKWRT